MSGFDEKQLSLEFFKKKGYVRKKCSKCGKMFWTLNPKLEVCMDSPCTEYGFISSPITNREYNLSEMREAFLSFFERNGHRRIRRYPVIARWRDDIYFTIASIADFQPHVTSGETDPPANPLVISQPCIRFNDIDAVGKSGRHLTNFEMMAHHAFNSKSKKLHVYWKDETVEYCLRFMTEELGIPAEEICFKENPWYGGGNAGAAFEVVARGLELATLVFMNLKSDPKGPIEIAGERYSEMDMYIVDTGYGLERLVWFSKGSPTIYDAIYPEAISLIYENSKISFDLESKRVKSILSELSKVSALIDVDFMSNLDQVYSITARRIKGPVLPEDVKKVAESMARVYAVADHTRALTFILGDGAVPSNVREGYFARMLIRRSIRMLLELGIRDEFILEILEEHLRELKKDFPEIYRQRKFILDVTRYEVEKYRETLKKGRELVRRMISRKGRIGTEDLIELYDSHGIPPEIVKQVAAEMKKEVEIPPRFYALVAERHEKVEKGEEREKEIEIPPEIPQTVLLYYEDEYLKEFDAKVIWSQGNYVVLDRTAFYPKGGGQESDRGYLVLNNGEKVEVLRAFKSGGRVVHEVSREIREGERVHGVIDWERRSRLMRHHTSTHIILAASRRVLGDHVWQAGAEKTENFARLDITHFKPLTKEEIAKIEREANKIVLENYQITKKWVPRKLAEEKYGFRLYQGGVPPGREIRVVIIGPEEKPVDVEACGGTHLKSTLEVGFIKLLSATRIQDGVVRLEYAAGKAALEAVQREYFTLREIAEKLNSKEEEVAERVNKLIEERNRLFKEVQRLKEKIAELEISQGIKEIKVGRRILRYLKAKGELSTYLEKVSKLEEKDPKALILIYDEKGNFFIATKDESIDLQKIGEALRSCGIKCGGRKGILMGRGNPRDLLEKIVKNLSEAFKEREYKGDTLS